MVHPTARPAHDARCRPLQRRGRFAAFTLLEILIATLLSATLLALLWGTFNMYLRLFETGERVTREAQLLLGISRQFFESIQAVPALEPPPAASSELSFSALPSPWDSELGANSNSPNASGDRAPGAALSIDGETDIGSSAADSWVNEDPSVGNALGLGQDSDRQDLDQRGRPLPHVGLVGSYDRLTLYGVQSVPAPPIGLETERAAQPSTLLADAPPEADDLRSVHYRFIQPSPSPNRTELGPRGLLRIETAWQRADARTFDDEQLEQLLIEKHDAAGAEAVDRQIANMRRERDGLDALMPEELVLLPEVAGIKFRYFDGISWHDAWDSRLEHRLPLAVEVFLQLREDAEIRNRRARRASDGGAPLARAEDAASGADAIAEEDGLNTLELYDPDDPLESESAAAMETAVHRILIPCAAAVSDARRGLGSEAELLGPVNSADTFLGGEAGY